MVRCQSVTTLPSVFLCWVLGNLLMIYLAISQTVADSSTVPDSGQIQIKAAVLLTSGSDLPFDYYNLAPVIDLALQRVSEDYHVSIELQLALYPGQCNVSQAVGQAVQAIIANVDLIIGPACTPDMIAVSQITTYYRLSLLTGAGSLTDSTGRQRPLCPSISITDISLLLIDDLLVRLARFQLNARTFCCRRCISVDNKSIVQYL